MQFEIGSNVVNFSNMASVKERLIRVRGWVQGMLEDAEMRRELCRAQILDEDMEYGEVLIAFMQEYTELCDQISEFKAELAKFDGHMENISKLELTSERLKRDLRDVEADFARMVEDSFSS
ncbi:hypothetical protein CAEBREN_04011 [Caenorhabditis brenneri]|uniref:Uncharacterized protein n=1 Tax=Caenorhabditis brenneri TaxID=135651 RepID=G0MSM5_CAEBE|nr:hypothetical protein CAEBREN_04011 [Caenorhabditis brenneri]